MDNTPDAAITLEDQVRLLMDEREVTRVLLALSRTVDQKDFHGLAALYALEGTLITPRATHRGRAGLADFVTKDIGHYKATHHIGAGFEIEIHSSRITASARMTLHATHVTDTSRREFGTVGGFYNIKLVREEGQWRLSEVLIQPQWYFSTEAKGHSLLPIQQKGSSTT